MTQGRTKYPLFLGIAMGFSPDMARTAINVTGDSCVAAVVAKTEGELRDVERTA